MKHGAVRIGISGWRYPKWRGSFYPQKLAQRRELEYASRQFNSIELNGSFYSLQRPENFLAWRNDTPDDFVFSVKGSRYVTHMRKLSNIEAPLANFFAQGLLRLGPKLGPILWQFPPSTKFEPEKFESFFSLLPKTFSKAARFAQYCDEWMKERAWLDVEHDAPLRHTVEIRNKSFVNEEFITLLRQYGIGLVVADTVEWPRLMDVTTDFVYCRLHGSEVLYASGYGDDAIQAWAKRVAAWAQGGEVKDGDKASATDAPKRATRDVYIYFDNDMKVCAPKDAASLTAVVSTLLEK